jgi:DNA-binding CsgD family transcriptional regulator
MAPVEWPLRRIGLTRSERTQLQLELRRYWWWVESGRRADRWLESGVARAKNYAAPATRHHRPSGGYAPVAAPVDETDAWLLRMDEVIQSLEAYQRQLVRWKGSDRPLTNAEIAQRWGCSERFVVSQWHDLALHLVNELWPGTSSRFARP